MTRLVLIVVGVLILLLVLAVILLRRIVRRAGRHLAGWRSRVLELRPNVLPPGPRRETARLRYRLDAELRATRDMLQHAPQGVVFRADAAALLRELATTGVELDAELAAIERFMNSTQQRAALATVAGQVEQLIDTSYTARQTILRTAAEDRVRHLDALRDNVAVQAKALDNYKRQRHQPSL